MTIREKINRDKRRLAFAAFACFLGLAAGPVLTFWSGGAFAIIAIAAFVVLLGCIGYAYLFGFRCPACRGPLHVLALQMGMSPLWIDPRIRFCPFCGIDIDAKDGAPGKPSASHLLE